MNLTGSIMFSRQRNRVFYKTNVNLSEKSLDMLPGKLIIIDKYGKLSKYQAFRKRMIKQPLPASAGGKCSPLLQAVASYKR